MERHDEEFKQEIIKKMLPPNAISVPQLHRETGIARSTLYKWKDKCESSPESDVPTHVESRVSRVESVVSDAPADVESSALSGKKKLDIVIETASMNTPELLTYCRQKGFLPRQILAWKEAATLGNDLQDKLEDERKKVQTLERELLRKDKALAEIAALLVLQKEDEG